MFNNSWHKKERPFLGITGMGGGVGSNLLSGAGGIPGMKASGGILHEYTDPGPGNKYRCHIFLQPGSLAVTEADGAVGTMDYLVVGGGGGAAGNNAGGGGGGGVYTGSQTIGALTYPVTGGAGGKGTWTCTKNPTGSSPPGANNGNALQGIPSYFTDPSGPTTRTAGGGGGSLQFQSHIDAGTLTGLSPGGAGGGSGHDSPGPGGAGNGDAGAQPGGGGGSQQGGGGGAGGTAGNAGAQPTQATGGDGYPVTIFGNYIPAPEQVWGGGGGGTSNLENGSPAQYQGGAGGAGGGGCGSGDSPGGGPTKVGGDAWNVGFFARCDPGGSPRGNNGGDGGLGTGGGGGGGGRGRNGSNQPQMIGPKNYNPTRQWQNAGGDGGPGIVVFRYQLPAAYELDYTKATGGFTHKVQNPEASDDGMVYHVMVDSNYAGPGPNEKNDIHLQPACRTFTVGPASFNAHIVIVGAGGGAGFADAPNRWSGGGGGGGLVSENPAIPLNASMVCKYTVGHAGQGCGNNPTANSPSTMARGGRGDSSVFANRISPTVVYLHKAGGGGGGGIDMGPGGSPGESVPGAGDDTGGGGSGGGGAGSASSSPQYGIPGNAGAPGEGNTQNPTEGGGTWVSYANNGGWARGAQSPGGPGTSAGGGGGAGGAGSVTPTDPVGGAGGDAKAMPAFPSLLGVGTPGPVSGVAYFAGGGGGGGCSRGGIDSGGAGGGGGAGGVKTGNSAAALAMGGRTAKMGTGSGGGGGGSPAFSLGGPGGSGCIIIKYPSS